MSLNLLTKLRESELSAFNGKMICVVHLVTSKGITKGMTTTQRMHHKHGYTSRTDTNRFATI